MWEQDLSIVWSTNVGFNDDDDVCEDERPIWRYFKGSERIVKVDFLLRFGMYRITRLWVPNRTEVPEYMGVY